jgi:hypothetical protein
MRRSKVWIAGLIVMVAGLVFAEEADIGFRGGYMRLPEGEASGLLPGAFLRMAWKEVIFIEGAGYYHAEELSETADLETIPLQLSAMVFLMRRSGRACPFILGGAGVYWTRATEEGQEAESELDIGWHVGGGLDFTLVENVFLELDYRHIWLDVDVGGRTFADALSDSKRWTASVGLGFRL